ncbi:MAG: YfiR family protein [Nitrospiraceae bacterium]|nr:MAG: YfiR family protein [Nitrospiraceae bacterium]
MKKIILFILFFISPFYIIFAPDNARSEELKPGEYQVKAAFLYNFLKFIEWPEGPVKTADAVTLCILGEDPFGRDIDIIRGKAVRDRVLSVRNIGSVQEAGECRILFISPSERKNIAHILEKARGSGVVTIGDTEGFAQQGVIINFFLENDRVRFEINIEAAKKADLQISSKLLKLARIVENTGPTITGTGR